MNLQAISRYVGGALLVSALFMLLSIIVSAVSGPDSALPGLLISFIITVTVGAFPFIFVHKSPSVSLKEGYLVIVLSWLLSFIFGALPYALWGGPFTLVNAWFESVSGFTTTGGTILDNIEMLPAGLQFWRCATHFIGGLGVVVFLLLILPDASPVRLRLSSLEVANMSNDNVRYRSNKSIFIFVYVYLAIFVLAFFGYLIVGMNLLDAVCHAFSVAATGGFSTRNLSIAAYDSVAVEVITMAFMYLSSINFGMLFISIVGRTLKPLNNPVLKFYTGALVIFSLIVSVLLRAQNVEESFAHALRTGAFQTLSVASTTGFAIADNSTWPLVTNIIMMLMAVMCGCAGSTTGGIKADRLLLLFKSIRRKINNSLHPSAVNEVRMGAQVLKDEDVFPHLLYIALYFSLLVLSVIFALLLGANSHCAFAGSVSSLGNVGPAIEEIGSMGSFNSLPDGVKIVFTLDMFLGRVEIYPVLAVLAMIFPWRRR